MMMIMMESFFSQPFFFYNIYLFITLCIVLNILFIKTFENLISKLLEYIFMFDVYFYIFFWHLTTHIYIVYILTIFTRFSIHTHNHKGHNIYIITYNIIIYHWIFKRMCTNAHESYKYIFLGSHLIFTIKIIKLLCIPSRSLLYIIYIVISLILKLYILSLITIFTLHI